jgi:hypothetical protein
LLRSTGKNGKNRRFRLRFRDLQEAIIRDYFPPGAATNCATPGETAGILSARNPRSRYRRHP